MKPSVYIETTIVSYLAARNATQLQIKAQQQQTHDWWTYNNSYKLYTSDLVYQESNRGDPEQALIRSNYLNDCDLLVENQSNIEIAKQLLLKNALPEKSIVDATHIAIAAENKIDYLLTWNCKHIANPITYTQIVKTLTDLGLKAPLLLTPTNLLAAYHAKPD